MPELCALLLSPFGRYSPSQVGVDWRKIKNWNAKGKWRGWHRMVKCPLQGIQEMGNSAKFLPIFSTTASCCLSAWTSHLAFPWLVLHCTSGAQLRGMHRAIFRWKLLRPHPAKQAGEGFFPRPRMLLGPRPSPAPSCSVQDEHTRLCTPSHLTPNRAWSVASEGERIMRQAPTKPSTMWTKEKPVEGKSAFASLRDFTMKCLFFRLVLFFLQGNSNRRGFSCKFCAVFADSYVMSQFWNPETASNSIWKTFYPLTRSNLFTLKKIRDQKGSCQQAARVLN